MVIKNIGGDFMNNEIKAVFGNQIKHILWKPETKPKKILQKI